MSASCQRHVQPRSHVAAVSLQTMGFGKLAAYHADDEYAFLSDFKDGFKVLMKLASAYTTDA